MIRIVTFNVHFGKNTDAIVHAFLNNNVLRQADIIYFQEIEHYEAEKISRAKKIADALSLECAYMPARKIKMNDTHGLAILSKYSLSEVESVTLPRHTMYFRTRERIAMNATIHVNGVPIRLSNIHLDTRINIADRILQMRSVVDAFKANGAQHVILGGDMNTIPFGFYKTIPYIYRNQKKALHEYLKQERFSVHCEDVQSTLKRGFLSLDLDGIYLRNMKGVHCGVLHSIRVSDHHPVWVDAEV